MLKEDQIKQKDICSRVLLIDMHIQKRTQAWIVKPFKRYLQVYVMMKFMWPQERLFD